MLAFLALGLSGCLRERDPDRVDPITGLPARIPENRRGVSSRAEDERERRTPASLAGRSDLGIRDRDRDRDRDSDRDRDRDRDSDKDRGVRTTGWTGSDIRDRDRDRDRDPNPRLQPPVVPRESRSFASGPAPKLRSFEEGQAFLTARGCRWQRLEQRDNEWFFTCSVPNRGSSSSVKTYEAVDKYGLLAIQKVIDKIARDQGER